MKASWKTTAGGILAAIGGILATAAMPDGYIWINTGGSVLASVGTLIIGATARDNDVSSEQSGAK